LIAAGIRRVIVGIEDPFAEVAGRGINKLREAGIPVETGLQADAVRKLTAPFLKLVQTGRPYVHAKWAMTLDGKIATRTGASRWISNEASRQIVHELRGRMDAILVGVETALKDDPLLTARPAGLRTALRIVLDSRARLPMTSQLVQTAHEIPVLLATGPAAREEDLKQLEKAGVEILVLPAAQSSGDRRFPDPGTLLDNLGKRRLTNLLVEGGGGVLGSFFDALLIDFVHVFIAPKVFGGIHAPGPVGGDGLALPPQIPNIDGPEMDIVQGDLYVRGALKID
jgi:diaminohydroxyphosphoribosylaminopyrimidine deaminase/5-amino-6-(5-phosphoribosylamino)uracil reductase